MFLKDRRALVIKGWHRASFVSFVWSIPRGFLFLPQQFFAEWGVGHANNMTGLCDSTTVVDFELVWHHIQPDNTSAFLSENSLVTNGNDNVLFISDRNQDRRFIIMSS